LPRGLLYAAVAVLLFKYGRFDSESFFYTKF
jgi:hypothetical protein